MEHFLGLSGTAWTAIYTIITFGLLCVAVVAALYAGKQWRSGKSLADDARRAQLEARRPYIIVSVEESRTGPPLFDLTVKNIGQRPAFDVSITLDPPPKRASDRGGHEIAAAKMFNEPVAMIAPDQELRTFYDNQAERSGREDLPTSHQVSLTYRDSSGHSYSEMSVLDLEALKGTMAASIKTLHDIGKILEKIQKTLQRASLLQQSGSIEVGASIETHDAKVQRLNEARTEQQEKHRRIVEKFTPEKTGETQTGPDASHQEDASDC